MTYYELKALKRRVEIQKLKVAALREQAVSVSQAAVVNEIYISK